MSRAVSDASRASPAAPAPALAAKVAFLSEAAAFGGGAPVRAVETHLSWVFLTEHRAYKLKKPLRRPECDLRTLGARSAHCRLEIVLNRRLSDGVYLGVVALTCDALGELHLGDGHRVVDWLIEMRRLPADRMLDRLIVTRRIEDAQLRPFVERLARFHRACPPEPIRGPELRARLAARIAQNAAQLCAQEAYLSRTQVEDVAERQLALLERHAEAFERRVSAGRIIEGHGDLRPEHVCLEHPPQVIDCLEFSRELRVLDGAEELGFLALECERLGAPRLKAVLFEMYAAATGDRPPAPLVEFYQSHHACTRARLAAARLAEPHAGDGEGWVRRASDYLRLAREHLSAAAA